MIFNSLDFVAFFILFFIAYWSLAARPRLILSLAASYFFYAYWDYRFLALIGFSTLVDYFVGLAMSKSGGRWRRNCLLLTSLASNLGLLAAFKYFDFFRENLADLLELFGMRPDWPTLNMVLPVGISFYTFQTLSYSIDVYRRKIEPERDLLRFATFVAFFPQLVAGPIVRASEFLPQLRDDRLWDFRSFESGFSLIVLGFFKKVVIADGAAMVVDHLFDNPNVYTSVNTAVVMALYAFQIYGDFSGYSDIAIGIARTLGYDFPRNFHFPYFARSFRDFWHRWHITLSTWLRDYLYIPLGGSRGTGAKTARNILITMLLGGLWHGASWLFLLWGFLHGGLLVAERYYRMRDDRAARQQSTSSWTTLLRSWSMDAVRMLFVFAVVCTLWVVFRSQSLSQAGQVLSQLLTLDGFHPGSLRDRIPLLQSCALVGLLVMGEFFVFSGAWKRLQSYAPWLKPIAVASLIWLIALFGTFDGNAFIYFQF